MVKSIIKKESMVPFYLIVLYLFLEYVRPQLLVPFLRNLHIPAITVILIAISLLFSGKLSFKGKQTVLYIVLLGEMVIHGPIAVNNYWAFQRFYEMSVTFIAYLGIINFVDSEEKYDKLIKLWLNLFIFLAIFGILNKGVGVGGFIGDENDFCMAMNMVLPFALFGIFSANGKSKKIYFLFLICLYLSSILTYSRGGFVGLASVMIYCWIRSNKKIVFSLIMGVIVIFALLTASSSYWDRVGTISAEYSESVEGSSKGTGGQRIYAWKIGWKIFIDNPVIGVGQGNYPWHVGKTEDEMGVQWEERSLAGRAAHSLYFTLLPELGLVGTFIFLLMIIFSIKDLIYIRKAITYRKEIYSEEESKKIYYLAMALEGSLVGFLTSSVFISTLYYPNLWLLLAFIISLRRIVYNSCGDLNLARPRSTIRDSIKYA